jgi:ubiquinone/menaquinone biosynthesis C-methylase UbiE
MNVNKEDQPHPHPAPEDQAAWDRLKTYWDTNLHDMQVVTSPVGSAEFFSQLDEYRFDKQRYLPPLVDFPSYRGKKVLEVGCGAGIDLMRFAREGAQVTGIDISDTGLDLARAYFSQKNQPATFERMNGEAMSFPDGCFDAAYCHGVLPYTPNPAIMIKELHRVLKPGGVAIVQTFNSQSWMNALSKVMKVELEHTDAPVSRMDRAAMFRSWFTPFEKVQFITERFPVKTRLQTGAKAKLYNAFFVGPFNILPRSWVEPLGWHLLARAWK